MTTFLGAIGVPHYTKDGKLYTGEMHKDASGRLMSGKFHTANSQFLFHTKNGIGGINSEKGYNVYFYHKRNEELESEFVIAKSEKEAVIMATKKHRKTYPRQVFSFHKITK